MTRRKKRKPIRINPDWGHRNADWLKQLPAGKEDLKISVQVTEEFRRRRQNLGEKKRCWLAKREDK